MSRSIAWRTNCPQSVKNILERLPSSRLLLVRRIGPTSFLLSEREGREKFKTSIGDPHYCSCGDNLEICVHILFILCNVFFLPKENSLVWQRSLVEAEIDELLRVEKRVRNVQKMTDETGIAAPRQIEEGDVCIICFEELSNNSPLCYCQGGCGNHLHLHCFKQYKRHDSVGSLRCPYCRSLWINDSSAISKKCTGCKKYVIGECYRCLFCKEYFLCSNCFHSSNAHANHPFSLLGARDVVERNNRRSLSHVQPVREPSTNVSAEVLQLMYRDIDPDDYETLLQLDEGNSSRVLTKAQFASLKSGNWDSSSISDVCHICLDSFDTSSSCVWLQCGHVFHKLCAKKWLTEHAAVCPLDHNLVVVPVGDVHATEANSLYLPSPGSHRPAPRQREEIAANLVVSRRIIRRQHRRVERPRNVVSTSLPYLELRALPLGYGQRRGQHAQHTDRFIYGGF